MSKHLNKKSRKVFSILDDLLLLQSVNKNPDLDWKTISKDLVNRTPRQCRERWMYYLSQERSKENWTEDEDNLLKTLVNKFGKKWSEMKFFFPKRNYSDIKNRWYAFISKKKEIINSNSDNFGFEKNINEKISDLVNNIENKEFIWEFS